MFHLLLLDEIYWEKKKNYFQKIRFKAVTTLKVMLLIFVLIIGICEGKAKKKIIQGIKLSSQEGWTEHLVSRTRKNFMQ